MQNDLLRAVLSRLDRGDCPDSKWPDAGGEYWSLCPFHPDESVGSFSVHPEEGFFCFVCKAKGSLMTLGKRLGIEPPSNRGLTLTEYAHAKHLREADLRKWFVCDGKRDGHDAVCFPYQDEAGHLLTTRHRVRDGFKQKVLAQKGAKIKGLLYGLWRLPEIRKAGWVVLVEGESDCHTLWAEGVPALGVPGTTMWSPSSAHYFDGLDVFVWQEPDTAGKQMAQNICRDLPNARIIASPDFKDPSDAHLHGVPLPALVESLKAHPVEAGLPSIQINGVPLRDQTAAALAALEKRNDPPTIFWRAGTLARIGRNERDAPVVETLTESATRGAMARTAEWIRTFKQGGARCVAPPIDVVRDLLALGTWPFPALAGIVEAPILRPDGSARIDPGYDPFTRLFYAPAPGFCVPNIPTEPTEEQTAAALATVREPMKEFPWASDADASNALGALLTPITRPMVAGCVPMGIIDAPQAGSGKSLLAEIVATVATGRPAAMMAPPGDDNAWRKMILSQLISGASICVIDNVEGRLWAPSLGAALTSSVFSGRLLGLSRMASLEHRLVWFATGNNVRLAGDLPRRCYSVRLDAEQARPWRRAGFTHPDLSGWTLAHRGEILGAALTLVRSWVVAGRPVPDNLPTVGGFSEWSRTIGGTLAHAGVEGFLTNLDDLYDSMDSESQEWDAFLVSWYAVIGQKSTTASDLAKEIGRCDALADALPSDLADAFESRRSFNRRLGAALAKRDGVRSQCGLHIERYGSYKRAVTWRVRPD